MRVAIASLAVALLAAAAPPQTNPLTSDVRSDYTVVRNFILRAAEKMSAGDYEFRPTPEVRSFGQLIGHITDDQYRYCSAVRGETRSSDFEKNTPPKEALRTAFAYCDATYNAVSDASATDAVQFAGRELPKISVLARHAGHAWEHYGNAVVYMRLRGQVPPSSEKKP